MRTKVEFRSAKFPAYEGEENVVNPNLWGKRLAEYLSLHLRAAGVRPEEIYAEDWGWAIPLQNDGFKMWVGCGHYQEYPDGYLVFIEPNKPYVRKFLKKIDTIAEIKRVADALDKILTSDPDIQNIRWWGADAQ